MHRVETARLAADVSLAVARAAVTPGPVPILRDARLADDGIADETVAAAAYHAILPLLWSAAQRESETPTALVKRTRELFRPLVARDLRLAKLLPVVDGALTASGIGYAVFKGPAVARSYPSSEQRMFSDLDVLISRADVIAADEVLRAAGLRVGWSGVPNDHAEAVYVHESLGTVDVHWHVMREPQTRNAFALDTATMLQRAGRVSVSEGSALCLDDVDEFIAVATHACFDGAYRLGWLVDLAMLMREPEFSWEAVRERGEMSGTSLAVQVMVDRAARTLGMNHDDPLVTATAWRTTLAAVSAARPVERTFRQVGRGGLVYRATRRTSAASFAALARLAWREAFVPFARNPSHRWRVRRAERF